jgi:hypothetical protein
MAAVMMGTLLLAMAVPVHAQSSNILLAPWIPLTFPPAFLLAISHFKNTRSSSVITKIQLKST